jgi:hypothetical protein
MIFSFKQFLEEAKKRCPSFHRGHLEDLEKFGDRLLNKYGVDVKFTSHFHERMSDDRNDPCVSLAELQRILKKISKEKGKQLKALPDDSEGVIVDLQKDLNIPFAINFDKNSGELEIRMKTVLRKKNFVTVDTKIYYEETQK